MQTFATFLCAVLLVPAMFGQTPRAAPAKGLRLYVFNCGTLHFDNADAYALKKEEVANLDMSVPAFLIVHPKGTLLFEAGIIPDTAFTGGAKTVTAGIATSSTPLLPQLAGVGYTPADITFVAFSHYHSDHIANANAFAGSTWLARKADRDMMFANPPRVRNGAANFAKLKDSKTILLESEDHDVFGDGSVVLKSAPGHTPGHQVLFLKLAQTGPIVLGGDLYHYPEERALHRLPPRDFSVEQTAASRAAIEAFLQKTGAQLWIEHDIAANAKLRKAPAFYE
jgi:glyoxylase-like metal-dependent hydrolase (beta-lactamase superfamily II)